MIAGFVTPDKGEVLVNGARLKGDTDPKKRKIGLVPQDLALYDELSARANLRFFGALYNLSGSALDKACDQVIARARNHFGNSGSIVRSTRSSELNSRYQPRLWCGARDVMPTERGSSRNNSSMPTPFGFFARGFSAASTRSGTSAVFWILFEEE